MRDAALWHVFIAFLLLSRRRKFTILAYSIPSVAGEKILCRKNKGSHIKEGKFIIP